MISVASRILNRWVHNIQVRKRPIPTAEDNRVFVSDETTVKQLKKSMEIYEGLDSNFKYPRRYIGFIQTFSKIVTSKTVQISEREQRIQVVINFYIF